MRRVTLVGVGLGNPDTLTLGALRALEEADLLLGARRLLEALPASCGGQRLEAARPDAAVRLLSGRGDWQTACVLLSGDLGLFSGAKGLRAALEAHPWQVASLPGVSSAQYLAARLGRPWQDWRFVSAHGVPCDAPARVLEGGEVFFATGGENTVQRLCAALCDAGLSHVRAVAGERLSYPQERIVQGAAATLAKLSFDPLSVLLVNAPPSPSWPFANPGIPDERFQRGDVPMTKQEVRAAALAKLGVGSADVVWDIGAGTGSVSVELALLARRGRVYAVERDPRGVDLIRQNARAFGVGNLQVVQGAAPEALRALPPPAAVFVGGSGGGMGEILAAVRQASPTARVCVACIALESLAQATAILQGEEYTGCHITQIAVSRSQQAGSLHLMKALNPVFLVSAQGRAATS